MRIAICHNAIAPGARADEQDVLVQVATVQEALQARGHTCDVVPVDLDLSSFFRRMQTRRPDVLFNLVESFSGSDRLASVAVAAMERAGIPLTGSAADVLWLSNDKVLAKERLHGAGLPTPEWFTARAAGSQSAGKLPPDSQYILKPIGEHASLGMDADAVVRPSSLAELRQRVVAHEAKLGVLCFAERFIPGREFNVSLLARAGGCEVLPLAEIDFSQFPPEMLRIVDYRAKWDPASFEFQNTPRRFLPSGVDAELAALLAQLAAACWELFDLRGYARVDFRVDEAGKPWILEINTNPCLSPDAGFAAALDRAGISTPEAVERIVADAFPGRMLPAERGALPSAAASPRPPAPAIVWRDDVRPEDSHAIRELVAATGFFNDAEIAIAQELVDERLAKGVASEYFFVLAELDQRIVGYASWGPIAGTQSSVDLYWIAVHPEFQKHGLGRQLLSRSEAAIAASGGRRVYIETSGREQYGSTRGFYTRCGYQLEAVLQDFYGPGDDKLIYVRDLGAS